MAKNEIVQIKNLLIWQKENKIYFLNRKSKNSISIEFEKQDFEKHNNFDDFIAKIEENLFYNGFTIKWNFNEFLHLQRTVSHCLHDVLLHFNLLNYYDYLLFNFDAKSQNEKLTNYIQKVKNQNEKLRNYI